MTRREYDALQGVTARAFAEYNRGKSPVALLIWETLEEVQEMLLAVEPGRKQPLTGTR